MRLGLGLALSLATCLPTVALAQEAETTYEMRIRSALDLVASDRDGAMRGLREAVAQDPSRPDAYCYVAEIYRLQSDLTSALDDRPFTTTNHSPGLRQAGHSNRIRALTTPGGRA